jgi:Family of unknown function (DUF6913)
MELFRNTRLKIGKALLKKKVTRIENTVNYSKFNLVRNIGIIWDASNPDEFQSLVKFYQKMRSRNIEVKILGYFPGKILPDKYTAIRYLTCIRKYELNFFYQPVSSEANTFISKQFDVLIDINFKKIFPLQYISSLSNAGFKVGLHESDAMNTPFNLLMEIEDPVDIDNYLVQIIEYLEIINSGSEIN